MGLADEIEAFEQKIEEIGENQQELISILDDLQERVDSAAVEQKVDRSQLEERLEELESDSIDIEALKERLRDFKIEDRVREAQLEEEAEELKDSIAVEVMSDLQTVLAGSGVDQLRKRIDALNQNQEEIIEVVTDLKQYLTDVAVEEKVDKSGLEEKIQAVEENTVAMSDMIESLQHARIDQQVMESELKEEHRELKQEILVEILSELQDYVIESEIQTLRDRITELEERPGLDELRTEIREREEEWKDDITDLVVEKETAVDERMDEMEEMLQEQIEDRGEAVRDETQEMVEETFGELEDEIATKADTDAVQELRDDMETRIADAMDDIDRTGQRAGKRLDAIEERLAALQEDTETERLADVSDKVDELQELLIQVSLESRTRIDQLNRFIKRLDALERQVDRMDIDRSDIDELRDELRAELAGIEMELDHREERLERELSRLEAEELATEEDIDSLRHKLEAQIVGLEMETEHLKNRFDGRIAELDNRITETVIQEKVDKEILQQALEEYRLDVVGEHTGAGAGEDMHDAIQALDERITEEKHDVIEALDRELRHRMEDVWDRVDELQEEMDGIESRFDELEEEVVQELRTAEDEREELVDHLRDEQAKIKAFGTQLVNLADRLEPRIDDVEGENVALQNTVEELSTRLTDLQQHHESIEAQVEQRRERLKEITEMLEGVTGPGERETEAPADRSGDAVDDGSLSAVRQEVDRLEREMEDLREMMEDDVDREEFEELQEELLNLSEIVREMHGSE